MCVKKITLLLHHDVAFFLSLTQSILLIDIF